MLALPIPDKSSTIKYEDLFWRGRNVGALVEQLTRGRQKASFYAHVDPDVRAELLPRAPRWRPALGQEGVSQCHLAKQGVFRGDLFLFWGLFQRVDDDLRRLELPFHALWGWLQVGDVADVDTEVLPALESETWRWVTTHPHVTIRAGQKVRKSPNRLYVAADRLSLPGLPRSISGSGAFDRFRPELKLSARAEAGVSVWSLPRWFEPGSRTPLTYHANSNRWIVRGDRVLLKTVGRGQEFVLNLDEYPEAVGWIHALLRSD